MKQLAQLASDRDSLAALGVGIVGVGPAAASQAARLQPELGFPLLLDPEHNLRRALGHGTQSLARFIFDIRAWLRYLWAFLTHRRQGRITGHYSNLPATAIVNADGDVVWKHLGRSNGDHPPTEIIRDRAVAAASRGPAS